MDGDTARRWVTVNEEICALCATYIVEKEGFANIGLVTGTPLRLLKNTLLIKFSHKR